MNIEHTISPSCRPSCRWSQLRHVPLALSLLVGLLLVLPHGARAQVTGQEPPQVDTTVIFQPARPLLVQEGDVQRRNILALDILFSGSGWGFGSSYQRRLVGDLTLLANFAFTPRRNSDEFENAWLGPIPVVANKVNRLFMIPIVLGAQYRLFSGTLQESFQPFVAAGVAPTLIIQTPYLRQDPGVGLRYYEFFESFGYAIGHWRVGAMVALGANIGNPADGSVLGVMIRYYTIPYGEPGLESIQGLPITNFGGVKLSLQIGTAW